MTVSKHSLDRCAWEIDLLGISMRTMEKCWIPPPFLSLLTPTRVFHSIFSGFSLTHCSIWIILESV